MTINLNKCFQELFRRGHEVAVHSITHDNDVNYWANATTETWAHEMGGMKDLLSRWANIPEEQIYGGRSPLLKLGGNRQMAALDNEESVEIQNLLGL